MSRRVFLLEISNHLELLVKLSKSPELTLSIFQDVKICQRNVKRMSQNPFLLLLAAYFIFSKVSKPSSKGLSQCLFNKRARGEGAGRLHERKIVSSCTNKMGQ